MSKEIETTEKKFVLFTLDHTKNFLSVLFIVCVVFAAGLITGWFMRSSDQCRIESAASLLIKQLK